MQADTPSCSAQTSDWRQELYTCVLSAYCIYMDAGSYSAPDQEYLQYRAEKESVLERNLVVPELNE